MSSPLVNASTLASKIGSLWLTIVRSATAPPAVIAATAACAYKGRQYSAVLLTLFRQKLALFRIFTEISTFYIRIHPEKLFKQIDLS